MGVATEVGNDEVQSLGTTPDQENKREDQNQDFDKFDLAQTKCDLFDNFHPKCELEHQILTQMALNMACNVI